jgi:hypothetical protein
MPDAMCTAKEVGIRRTSTKGVGAYRYVRARSSEELPEEVPSSRGVMAVVVACVARNPRKA